MNIEDTLAPKSDQLDAVDLLGGEQTFTISGVRRGNAEQPVQIDLAEFPRTWRPSKGMRRVLVACWGPDASQYVGRRVTLYCDTEVVFGSEKVGGTRIRALSHIDGPKTVPMIVKRGRSGVFTVQPLTEAPASTQPSLADRITQAVNAFSSLGVTVEQMTAKLGGRTPGDWTDADLSGLLGIYQSIQAGESTAADEFGGETS